VVRATGVEFDVFESHVWTVGDGRVTRFEVYLDTEALLTALTTPASGEAVAGSARGRP
jgi:ketosteroid isomerase-like protein